MQIKSQVPFIPDAELEARASALLSRYEREIEPVATPPVPIERIADFLLEIGIDWVPLPDVTSEPVLAYIDADKKIIRLNESCKASFEQYVGLYQFTLAHEVGHYDLHLLKGDVIQLQFEENPGPSYLCRNNGKTRDRREWQAERFASYLLLPAHLLLPAIQDQNLLQWNTLYQLRDQFQVSVTALKIRLEQLGYLYIGADKSFRRDKQEASEQLRLF